MLEAQVMLQNLSNIKAPTFLAQDQYLDWDENNLRILKLSFVEQKNRYLREYERIGLTASINIKRTQPGNHKANVLIQRITEKKQFLQDLYYQRDLLPTATTTQATQATQATQKESIIKKDSQMNSRKIFIVHGHDEEAKSKTARFVEKLGFEAIILHEQASSGKTIIEKIEAYSNVGFGIVLYTPCDFGGKVGQEKSAKRRARQNVVFEHGYLIGKLGRNKVSALVKGNTETPNDISGVVYISMNSDSWKLDLAKELKSGGLDVDMNRVL